VPRELEQLLLGARVGDARQRPHLGVGELAAAEGDVLYCGDSHVGRLANTSDGTPLRQSMSIEYCYAAYAMSKRLQVLLQEAEFEELRAAARRRGVPVSVFVRDALRQAESLGAIEITAVARLDR